ncbi:hypothetical protein X975_08548, partial [Stegodyphus mimosarum]
MGEEDTNESYGEDRRPNSQSNISVPTEQIVMSRDCS